METDLQPAASQAWFRSIETPGVCLQSASCDLGRSGEQIRVALRNPFVCPSCGSALAAPLQSTKPTVAQRTLGRIPVLACAALWLVAISGLASMSLPPGPRLQSPMPMVPQAMVWANSMSVPPSAAAPELARPRPVQTAAVRAPAGSPPPAPIAMQSAAISFAGSHP